MSSDEDDRAVARGPWGQPRFLAAAAVVCLIVIMAAVFGATLLRDGNAPGASPEAEVTAPGATAAAPRSPTRGDRDDSECDLSEGDQTIPLAPPPDTTWELVGTVAAPTAPDTIGPGRVSEEGLRSCFARNPLGTLYAAVNFLAATSDVDTRSLVVENLTADTEGREVALEVQRREPTRGSTNEGSVQIAGFTFLDYDLDSSSLLLALRVEGGTLLALPVTMRWEARDWKVEVPPDGDLYDEFQLLPDLSGYVPWSGA